MDALMIVRRIAARQDGIVTLAQARWAGYTVHEVQRLCRAGRWRALARAGYLVDPDLHDGVPRRARIRAAIESFGPAATAVLDTAAELHQIAGLPGRDAIHVSVPGPVARPVRRAHPELLVHQLVIAPTELGQVYGIRTTNPARTVADVILREERCAAVSVVDSALNRRLITAEELGRIRVVIRGRRGAVAARRYLCEADGRAQSPLETRVRLRCVDGKVAPDVLQHEVRDEDGYLLGVADLAWLRARVIAEADGRAAHGTPDAVFADRRRQNLLANAGWRVLRFTWADTLRPDYIPYTVRRAIAAAATGR